MIQSACTPGGEPLECIVCGNTSRVEASPPPKDSVCPYCGSFLWVISTGGQSSAKLAIEFFGREMLMRLTENNSVGENRKHFVAKLRRCLAAQGASLWMIPKRRLFRTVSPQLIGSDGDMGSLSFADEVITSGASVMRREFTNGRTILHLGVPVADEKRVTGAIEIVQRDVQNVSVQRGYVRFIAQMAGIAKPLTAS